MRKTPLYALSVFAVSALFASQVHAATMADACKKEIKKYKCDATSEQTIHECLEKHEKHNKKHDGFKAACYEAHEAYEKQSGTEEKNEGAADKKSE